MGIGTILSVKCYGTDGMGTVGGPAPARQDDGQIASFESYLPCTYRIVPLIPVHEGPGVR